MMVEGWLGRGSGLALESDSGALAYPELLSRARAGAEELLASGVRRGHRVAVAMEPDVDWVVTFYACLVAGAVPMPVDARLTPRERAPILERAHASLEEPLRTASRTASGTASPTRPRAHTPLEEPLATAGKNATTASGSAKGGRARAPARPASAPAAPASAPTAPASAPTAPASAPTALATASARPLASPSPALDGLASGPSDVAMVVHTSGTTGEPRPVALTYGNVLANALGCAVALGHDLAERWLCPLPLSHVGGLMVLLRSAIYGTTAVLGSPDRDDVTIASLVPTQLSRLLDRGVKPPRSLRVVMLGGAPADPTLLTRAKEAGWPVAPTYGLTQACSAVTVAEPGDTATSGRPIPGVTVTTAPDGEILVDGPTVAGGGMLHTGDLGRLDDRGRLVVVGRKADTIVTGGENVAPAEVEAVLLQHPAVAEAGVFGRVDGEWGQAVTAQVVLRAAVAPDELRAWCAERLAGFKVPKAVEPVHALPRNAAGKLLRRELA